MQNRIRKVKPYYCPACRCPLRGEEIKKSERHLFGATHGGLEIGIYSRELDRTVAWKCPCCFHTQAVSFYPNV